MGLFHGSFRITDKSYERRSIELRFLVFETHPMPSRGGNNKTIKKIKSTKSIKKYTTKRKFRKMKTRK